MPGPGVVGALLARRHRLGPRGAGPRPGEAAPAPPYLRRREPLSIQTSDRVDVKTTLAINDQLLAEGKALAAQRRTSLTRLIEEGLQLRLRGAAAKPARGRARLPVYKGRGGLVGGFDPRSNKSLLDALGDDA